LGAAVAPAQARCGMPGGVPIVSGDEAGRAGFWRHRYWVHCGGAHVVVDASSSAVHRRARRAKTARVAVEPLLRLLSRSHPGAQRGWSVGHVPRGEEEEARRLPRAGERLQQERPGHRHRIQALCVSQGGRGPPRHDLLERWAAARLWDGSALPPALPAEVRREEARLRWVDAPSRALAAEQGRRLAAAVTPGQQHRAHWRHRRGMGRTRAWVFSLAYFGGRQCQNRQEGAALAGLTPRPSASGDRARDQGMSQAGKRRLRTLRIQMAWGGLRAHPPAALSLWCNTRLALGGKRMRRIGIVALARRLLMARWRYGQSGAMPEGASLTPLEPDGAPCQEAVAGERVRRGRGRRQPRATRRA
jgi:transposase